LLSIYLLFSKFTRLQVGRRLDYPDFGESWHELMDAAGGVANGQLFAL
jgi:choline-glycine betaine transporter